MVRHGGVLRLRSVGAFVLVWAVVVGAVILVFGAVPKTWIAVFLLVFVGPVALVAAEGLAEIAVGTLARIRPVAAVNGWAHRRTEGKEVSALRISIVLAWVLLAGAALGGAVFLLNDTAVERWFDALGEFWNRHFT